MDGSVRLIPGFGGDGGFAGNHACGINNLGQVVGHSDLAGDTGFSAFFWSRQTGTAPLKPLDGDFASLAISINDRGQVVGGSLDENFVPRAMLWPNGAENNGMGIDLNTPRSGRFAYVFAGCILDQLQWRNRRLRRDE